jgi:hypothetical protein
VFPAISEIVFVLRNSTRVDEVGCDRDFPAGQNGLVTFERIVVRDSDLRYLPPGRLAHTEEV